MKRRLERYNGGKDTNYLEKVMEVKACLDKGKLSIKTG